MTTNGYFWLHMYHHRCPPLANLSTHRSLHSFTSSPAHLSRLQVTQLIALFPHYIFAFRHPATVVTMNRREAEVYSRNQSLRSSTTAAGSDDEFPVDRFLDFPQSLNSSSDAVRFVSF